LRTVLVPQNTSKNTGPGVGTTQAASIESVSLRRLVGVARGPIRRNWTNRLKTGPVRKIKPNLQGWVTF